MKYLVILLFAVMAIGFTVCGCLLQAGVQLTLSYGLFLLQGAVWMLFFFGLTWYELYDRLWVRRTDRKFE